MDATTSPIAILEGYAPLRSVLARLLADGGYRVICYSDASSLLADLRVTAPALLLLDLHLGTTLGGWPLLSTLRQSQDTTLLPILLMADAVFAHKHAARISRPHLVVQMKPLDFNDLLTNVALIYRSSCANDHHRVAISPWSCPAFMEHDPMDARIL